jgi:TorA maturation chaperone TorD
MNRTITPRSPLNVVEPGLLACSLDNDTAGGLKNTYMLFSLLFRYPDEAVYNELQSGLRLLAPMLEEYIGQQPVMVASQDLQAEYISLFVNNKGSVPAIPYGSYYLDGENMLNGRTTEELKKMMARAGFALHPDTRELEDHIHVQLEFCSILANKLLKPAPAKELLETMNMLARVTFLYIQPMMDPFVENIYRHARLHFYRDAGTGLINFINDTDHLFAQISGCSLYAGVESP